MEEFKTGNKVVINFDDHEQHGVVTEVKGYECSVSREDYSFHTFFHKNKLRHATQEDIERINRIEAQKEVKRLSEVITNKENKIADLEEKIKELEQTIIAQAQSFKR